MKRVGQAIVVALVAVWMLSDVAPWLLSVAERNLSTVTLIATTLFALPAFWPRSDDPPRDDDERRPFMPWLR